MADLHDYDQLFEASGQQYNVDPRLLKSVALTESGLNPFTSDSNKGAKGMMQFIDPTAAKFGIDPYDPKQAIDAAARYLSDSLTRHGSVAGALGDYYGKVDPGYIGKVAKYYGDNRSEVAGAAVAKPTASVEKSQGQMADLLDDFISGKLDAQLSGGAQPSAAPPKMAPNLPAGAVQPGLSPIDEADMMKAVETAHGSYKDYVNSVRANSELEVNLRNAAEAFRYFNSGVGTELGANVARFMRRIGVDPKDFNLADAAQVQSAKKSAALAVQAMMGKATDPLVAQWSTAEHATPNPSLEPNAVKDLIAGGLARISRTQDVAQSMQNYLTKNGGSLRGFDLVSTEANAGKNMPYYQQQALQSLPELAGEDKAMPPAMVLSPSTAAPAATAAPSQTAPQEGQIFRNKDGHRIQLKGGSWIDLSTGKPFGG